MNYVYMMPSTRIRVCVRLNDVIANSRSTNISTLRLTCRSRLRTSRSHNPVPTVSPISARLSRSPPTSPSSSPTHACACIYLTWKRRCTHVESTIFTGVTAVPVARRFETTGPPLRLQPSSAFVTVDQNESVRPLTPPLGISRHIYSSSHHPHSR